MKPVVDFRRCFSSKKVCTAIKCCPVHAVSYIELDSPINDKFLNCNCGDPNRTGKIPVCTDGDCGCGGSDGSFDLYSCGGTPYGRIIIDYDKCTRCGLCVKECCGTAIGLHPEDYKIEPMKGNPKTQCCCEGGRC
ncbi:MAG: 4Fe-4S binding protein [Oscillospiraceae bacterium]|nr:4Fe-4S binding protein [Oscillospiraceae bacterium]